MFFMRHFLIYSTDDVMFVNQDSLHIHFINTYNELYYIIRRKGIILVKIFVINIIDVL